MKILKPLLLFLVIFCVFASGLLAKDSLLHSTVSSSFKTKLLKVEFLIAGEGNAEIIIKNLSSHSIEMDTNIPFLLSDTVMEFPKSGLVEYRDYNKNIIKMKRDDDAGWYRAAILSSTLDGKSPFNSTLELKAHEQRKFNVNYREIVPRASAALENANLNQKIIFSEFRLSLDIIIIDSEKHNIHFESPWHIIDVSSP